MSDAMRKERRQKRGLSPIIPIIQRDPQADAVYLELTAAEVEESREIQPGIIVDYDSEG